MPKDEQYQGPPVGPSPTTLGSHTKGKENSMGKSLDLLGVTEVAEMFGVHRVTASDWLQEATKQRAAGKRVPGLLPEPDGWIGKRRQPVWRRSTIVRWAERTGREEVA
jgi:hypothetical protein